MTRSPLYAAEAITRDTARAAMAFEYRDNRFHPEARLPSDERAELADYVGGGFDRGHMAPSGDMSKSEDDFETFSLANMVPQAGALNRSGWAALEQYVRSLAVTLGKVYVVTGPSYESRKLRTIGGRVLVPSHVWKAVYVPGQGAGAWIATNEARSRWRVVSLAALTDRTGVDPFPALSAQEKRRVPKFPLFGESQAD
nr:DNA/RNA non-specific endonuclease [Sphingobium sp.]